ncbi:NADH-quinone oxidoreductase subunit NuoN, partial [Streptomyces sp. NPDC055078]
MSATAVHSLWTTAAEPIDKIKAPDIEYAQLAPILIVVGAAVVGLLLEAFLPRKARYRAQVFLTLLALVASFASILGLAQGGYGTTKVNIAAMGAIAIDGPTLFLQGTILLTSVVAVMTFAERRLD